MYVFETFRPKLFEGGKCASVQVHPELDLLPCGIMHDLQHVLQSVVLPCIVRISSVSSKVLLNHFLL